MFKIVTHSVFLFFLALLLVILQFSFISSTPYPWYNFNLLLLVLILAFLVSSKEKVFFLALAMGYLVDIFSFQAFGAATLSMFLSALIIYLVLENILTNRSLYSFIILAMLGILTDRFFYHLFVFIFDWSGNNSAFFMWQGFFWESLAWSLFFGLILLILSFHLIVILNKKLKPFFLSKG